MATSRVTLPECPPESGLIPGPVTLAVDSTCGPAGVVTATMSTDSPLPCTLHLSGAAEVGLGPHADVDWDERRIELTSVRGEECAAWETQSGVFALRCYAGTGGGCGRDNVPFCSGTIRIVPAAP